MDAFNIYLTGVGGQGTGLLSQALLRGIDHAGLDAVAVDTHGLAQRGGVVVSRIRCGDRVHSPLTFSRDCDLVLGMEIHEAMRGLNTAMKSGGTLVFLDVSWQPLPVRLGKAPEVRKADIESACLARNVTPVRVEIEGRVPDSRMQNMAILGTVAARSLVPGVAAEHFRAALQDLLKGDLLEKNQTLFESYLES